MIDIVGQPDLAQAHERTVGGEPAGEAAESDAEIYTRLAPELIRFAATLVGPSDAEDLLAAAVVKAIAAPGWPAVENRRAYLYRVIVNEARSTRRSRLRRHARELRMYRRDDFEPEIVDPAVMRALNQLTVRQRAVIHLTYWVDLAPRQVADILDVSLRTVERELTKARTTLEGLLS